MANETILIVDDDPAVRKGLAFLLESKGYRVIQAADGAEGFEAAVAHRPALVISDLVMPKMNGIQFYRKLRSRVDFKNLPFVFLSRVDDPRLRDMGRAIGVVEYLNKPIRGAALMATISHLLSESPADINLFQTEESIPDFTIKCPNCAVKFSFHESAWCDCHHSLPTKICPYCFNCLCRQDPEIKKEFWSHLPQEFVQGILKIGGRK